MKVRSGTLYLADLNPRIGTELGKLRPVLVVQTDFLNKAGHPSTWVLPCTTKLVGENLLRVPIPSGMAGNTQNCEVMIDQSRAIDNSRIRKMLRPLPKVVMQDVKEKLRLLADL